MILAVAVAAMSATFVAAVTTAAPSGVQTWVRRIFLLAINLSPWTIDTWRNSFSRRETFLAAWFLVFVVTLLACAFVPAHCAH